MKNEMHEKHEYHLPEEIFNALTHALGGYLGAAAVVLMVMFAVWSGEQVAWKVVSGSIFGTSIIVLYSASTLYHAVTNLRMKLLLRACDQMAIYALIAGTYTPFCLVTLRHGYPVLSWTIFGLVWGMTIAGIVFKLLAKGHFKYVTLFTYLAMGWFGIFLIKPLYQTFPFAGIVWLVLGGVLYTLGTVFYAWRNFPFNHGIWHLFVLGGTITHFFGILFYVMMGS